MKDLEFLEYYWSKAKQIGQTIIEELPKQSIKDSHTLKAVDPNSTVKMFIMQYKDLGDNWSVEYILNKLGGESTTLKILADKINYMILKGRANDVKPMVEKICSGRVKSLSKKRNVTEKQLQSGNECYHSEYLGKGHFRWNFGAHTLTPQELERLKEYFKINNPKKSNYKKHHDYLPEGVL